MATVASALNLCRLAGTRGKSAAIGEVLQVENGAACWRLHPGYAAWFWPLMSKVNDLELLLPEAMLEPVEAGDATSAPEPPTEEQKDVILKMQEREADCARVYTLAMRGKPALIRKAFPTRLANLAILRKLPKR